MSGTVRPGRPRVNEYQSLGEFLQRMGECSRELGTLRVLASTLKKSVWADLQEVEEDGRVAAKFRGEKVRCPTCKVQGDPKEFVVDPDHSPPRIRMTMPCGHRLDLIIDRWCKKCPKCGGELQRDAETKFCVLCDWHTELME